MYEVDAIGLTRLMAALNSGVDYSGKAIDDATSFHVGVAVNPVADDPGWELERFHQKIEAGARFAMTQVLFDSGPARAVPRPARRAGAGAAARRRLAGAQPRAGVSAAQRGAGHQRPGRRARPARAGRPGRRPRGARVARDLLAAVRDLAAGAYLVPPFKEPEAVLELLT